MRAHGGGKGIEERKEVRWVWMGRNRLGVLGLGFELDVEAAFSSHGKLKGMARSFMFRVDDGGGRR